MGDNALIILPLTLAVIILIITFTTLRYSSHVSSNSKKISSRQLDTINDAKKINDAKLLAVAWQNVLFIHLVMLILIHLQIQWLNMGAWYMPLILEWIIP